MDRDENRIDELLDAGLAGYSDVEPRAGIEGRIIARLSNAAAEPEQKAWLRWWPAWGMTGAIVIAMIVLFGIPRGTAKPPTVAVKESSAAAPKFAPAPQTTNISRPPQIAMLAVPHAHPPARKTHEQPVAPTSAQLFVVKKAIFPTPTPLSDQERLLVAYVRRTPREEIAANSKPDPLPEIQLNQLLPVPGTQKTDQNANTR